MQAVQYKHPSDHLYQTVKLTDPVDVPSKHYAIAVDIYDVRSSRILLDMINMFNRRDKLTVITFGEHSEKCMIYMDNPLRYTIVKNMLCRKEIGVNVMLGVRVLEHVEADAYVIVCEGNGIPCSLQPRHGSEAKQLIQIDMDASNHQVRRLMDIREPKYMDVKLHGTFGCMYVKAPPYGGTTVVQLLTGQVNPVKLTYMRSDGGKHVQLCDCQDDETMPDVKTRMHGMQIEHQTFMRPCCMVE